MSRSDVTDININQSCCKDPKECQNTSNDIDSDGTVHCDQVATAWTCATRTEYSHRAAVSERLGGGYHRSCLQAPILIHHG